MNYQTSKQIYQIYEPADKNPANLNIPGLYLIVTILLFIAASNIYGQTELTVQSPARPFGLDIIDTVQMASSDDRSVDFQTNTLPTVNEFINTTLGEKMALSQNDLSVLALDPEKLSLTTEADVRVYFVGEGAGYHNTLGVNTEESGVDVGNPMLIFPDASSRQSFYVEGADSPNRTTRYPLLPGDFVELGSMDTGTLLNFFLISNGVNGGTNVYSTDQSINPDGLQHVVAYAVDESPFLMIGFEDMYNGGDMDYNDLLFVIDIGNQNVQELQLTASLAPEPGTMGMLFSFLFISFFGSRRERKKQ